MSSGNKMTDTKVVDLLDMDSGMCSGPIDELPGDSGDIDDSKESHVPSGKLAMDSGIQCLSEDLSDVKISGEEQSEEQSVEEITKQLLRPADAELPVHLLFQQDDDGDTQLHIAASHGQEKSVSILIRVCPNKELLNIPNDYGQTALHLAVMSRSTVITRMLVLAGASLGARDRWGETPLHKATALRHVGCIQALLNPIMEHPQRNRPLVLDQKNYNGQACVHVAAALGHVESLQTLVFYGADINSRENLAGWTPLHVAASRGDTRLVQFLQRCAGVDAHAPDFGRRTPRRLARRTGAASLFVKGDDSDTDDDDDSDEYDSETESLFEKFSNQSFSIVA